MSLIFIKEGVRHLLTSSKAKIKGRKSYDGNYKEICKQIVEECWNGEFFQTSTRNFCQFWSRDFGICAEALIELGYKDEVIKTLDYALKRFREHGRITAALTPNGTPYDFPTYATDSLPFIIRSLKFAKDEDLIERYTKFLNKEIFYYLSEVFDQDIGLIRKDKHFSSMKDYAKRTSSTYDNCMAGMLRNDLSELKLNNPLARFDIKRHIETHLWNRSYFYDDLNKHNIVTGDANTFPFWTGVFDSKKMFESCLERIKDNKLDSPFPIKYASERNKKQKMIAYELLVKNYETNSVWGHMGLCFLDVVKKYDTKQFKIYLRKYKKLIEKNKNFIEVFDNNGNPFKSPFYSADEGMLWASKLLVL